MNKTCALLSSCLLVACATTQEPAAPPTAFRLTSPGNPDNAMMQPKNAGNFANNPNCTGRNVSPPLAWSNAPDKTRSFAIIWDDQAGRAGLGVSHAVRGRQGAARREPGAALRAIGLVVEATGNIQGR